MQHRLFSIILTALALASSAIASEAPKQNKAPAAQSAPAKPAEKVIKQKILFFLNPEGMPCQMQLSILKDMGTALTDKADIQFIPVQDPASRPLYEQYGIRGLPSLIILNAQGKETKRFSPGIQKKETILSGLGGK